MLGIRKGIVKSALNLAGLIASLIFSNILAVRCADWVYLYFFRQKVISSAQTAIAENLKYGVESAGDAVLKALPYKTGFFVSGFSNDVTKINNAIGSSAGSAAVSVEAVVAPIITFLLNALLFFVFFIFLLFLSRIVVNIINNVFKLPVLKQVNAVLGGLFGLVQGAIVFFIAVIGICIICDACFSEPILFSKNTVDDTTAVSVVYSGLLNALNDFYNSHGIAG